MSHIFYPNGPRRPQRPRPVAGPEPRLTVEDYEQLAAAYQELKARNDQQVKTIEEQQKALDEKKSELAIQAEALHRQGADLKQLESNLLWTRAALEQTQKGQDEAKTVNWEERYLELQAEV